MAFADVRYIPFRRHLFAAWRTAKPALEPLATLCAVAEQCGGQRALSPGGSGPEFQTKKNKNNFPVTVKIRTSGYQTSNHNSQVFMLYGRLVHVGEIFNRFWAMNCAKMRLATGPAAGAIALRRPRSRYDGREAG